MPSAGRLVVAFAVYADSRSSRSAARLASSIKLSISGSPSSALTICRDVSGSASFKSSGFTRSAHSSLSLEGTAPGDDLKS